MKKALWIFIFLLVVFAGDRLMGLYFKSQVSNSQFRYSRMYRGDAAADIMVIGNSRGLNIYLPTVEELTSKKAVSLCYNGMPGDLASALTRDYIDRYPNVKKIILELCIVEMGDEQLLPGFSSYMQYSGRLDSLIHEKHKQTWITSKVSHLYQFNNEVFQRALFYRNKLDNDWTSDRVMQEKLIKEVGKYGLNFKADSVQLQHIKTIADYCKSRSIELELVIAPFFPGFEVKNLALLKTRTEDLTGLKVYDYSNVLRNSASFSDYLHMNVTGCKEFVKMLGKDGLLTIGGLKSSLTAGVNH